MSTPEFSPQLTLPERRTLFYTAPWTGVQQDFDRIYNDSPLKLGVRSLQDVQIDDLANERRRGIMGSQLGDEGKGKLVAALSDIVLLQKGIERLDGIRWNGGNNAGHTVEVNGEMVDLHQVPSVIFQERATAILDKGMVINAEDLRTEIGKVENIIGSTYGRIIVSPLAVLATDLERAEEKFNNELVSRSGGGTGRGVSPAYAHRLDRTGFLVRDLLDPEWKKHFRKKYDNYKKHFDAHGKSLADMAVPDFKGKRKQQGDVATVGSAYQFLDRLAEQRQWLLSREMVQDTFSHHRDSANNSQVAVIFEGAQAVGLDPWVGTYPDTTSSNTTFYGVNSGTGYYLKENILQRLAIAKHNPSSVGERKMPTHINLSRKHNKVPRNATPEQKWAVEVRKIAKEVGTTTGRWRDMNHWDLAFLNYNLVQGGANLLGITHMDVQREDVPVRMYHSYKKDGETVGYQPNLEYLNSVTTDESCFVELPGWDGEAVARARSIDEMPENAIRALAFVQERTGVPVVVFTNGPEHDAIVGLPGFENLE